MKEKYNLKDIAKMAGVGVGTASRVINNKPGVKAETREKVLKVIKELNYVPNIVARTLKQNTSKLIGIIVKGVSNPFFSQVIEAIEVVATKKGYGTLLHYTDTIENQDDFTFNYLMDRKVEGIIYLGGYFDKRVSDEIAKLNVPVVAASTVLVGEVDRDTFSSVVIDNKSCAFEIVDYLCKKKHQKIGVIGSDNSDYIFLERLAGYREAIEKREIKYSKSLVKNGRYTFEGGYKACKSLLKKYEDITAIFATSDLMAIGAARAILESGYKIPEDISLVGFDGLENTKYFYPAITTVEQPRYNLGAESAELLFERLNDDNQSKVHKILGTKLLKRESVGEARN